MEIDERIEEITEELRSTPYNKATEHHIGRLKAKLARLREEAEKRSSSRGGGNRDNVGRVGDATVILIGPPSVGKSTLLNKLTSAKAEVGAYDFTTIEVKPGILEYEGAKIQILDVPGLIKGLRGGGREVASFTRSSDLVVLMTDILHVNVFEETERELYKVGIRLNQKKPRILVKKKITGGIKINSTVNQDISEETIKEVLKEYKMHNADVILRETIDINGLIDALMKNRVYLSCVRVINKIDMLEDQNLIRTKDTSIGEKYNAIMISAEAGINLEELKESIFKRLNLIKVYMKHKGEEPDYKEPMILKKGSTVEEICRKIHRDFVEKFRYAKVWGNSVKYGGQMVGLSHEVYDGDVVNISIER
ncbi:MAG: TGS domain-containing protein [Candidatus Methanolliviera hydrocarbonicum]|uniref:TGS domain-containing protein n=1 Tax=Candidatus Methanolliviera hydrocarbonicum TaxID=2491085 RepID=A0A520KVH4_9EURY|nr:MAG: TGS domain-containing protein [Candidatus Methanolliviera hydrocarbonicum]